MTILDQSQAIETQLVGWRREFHSHPETGFRETWTASRIAAILEELGCRVRTGVGKTGVVGELGQGQPLVGIRADMDALPIMEANQVPYASGYPGFMHACGHDSHIAMALGAAAVLAKERFPGTVRFIYQPAEEVADEEGVSGAPRMIADGVLDGMDLILALHVDPATPVGDIRVSAGSFSGGVDSFFATIIGRGGHGARPQEVVDPIHIAGHVLLALHGIVSRRLNPMTPAVVSVGRIHGGQAENVIPDQVELSGTIRFLEASVQQRIHTEVKNAFEIARALGGDYQLKIEIGVPSMINDAGVVDLISRAARDLLGIEHVLEPVLELGAEDFGCFTERVPGAMFVLGCQIGSETRFLHNPFFDIDEGCLKIGTAIFVESALRALGARK
jgi:amidohydrolase